MPEQQHFKPLHDTVTEAYKKVTSIKQKYEMPEQQHFKPLHDDDVTETYKKVTSIKQKCQQTKKQKTLPSSVIHYSRELLFYSP